jgi:soluble lytic murein transglycosylase-like protein
MDGFAVADQHLAMLGKATDIAARIAEAHQQELDRARIDQAVATGGLDGWIAQALQVLDLPQNLGPGIKKIIMAESGGNPHAINLTDSNARRGTPSQGLMQTIPTTFRHYVAPQLADRPITDPVANITAGVNYMVNNYGINTVAAGGRSNAAGSYIGY